MMHIEVPVFLDRLADAADYAVIGPVDGRRQILQTRRAPFNAVCRLERDFGEGRITGCTGFLVGPRLVLTAGHCVYSPARRLFGRRAAPSAIHVVPGQASATDAPFGRVAAVRWLAHRRYMRAAARPFDVGLIELAEEVRGVPPFSLHVASDAELRRLRQRRLVHISGYPGDKPRGTQWQHEERLDRVTPRDLFYSVDTCPGHSGAPVWVERWPGTGRSVVGIHTAGPRPHAGGAWGCRAGVPMAPAGHVNRGVRMTADLAAAVRAHLAGRPHADFVAVGRVDGTGPPARSTRQVTPVSHGREELDNDSV
jgi:V8-like Glu-specific endopeptidase